MCFVYLLFGFTFDISNENKTKNQTFLITLKQTKMKKLFITALAAIAIGTSAFAGPSSANVKINEHFMASFSKAKNVSWKSSDRFEKASFILNNEQVDAFYKRKINDGI